jgi:autotransporter strand-loop-strand O-heptosyltransferase
VEKLVSTIEYVKKFDRKVAVVTHYPLNDKIQSLVDYYIYDADNTLPDYRLTARHSYKGLKLTGWLDRPYHSLPIVKSIQNACKMFSNYEWMHFIEYDVNLDLGKHFSNLDKEINKEVVGYNYENTGVYTSIISFKPSTILNIISPVLSWDDYKKLYGDSLIFENWLYKVLLNAGKADSMSILNAESVDMQSDSFKQISPYHFVFSMTDKDEDILFIVHKDISSSKFKLIGNSGNPLVDCGDYSYVILDKGIENISIIYDDNSHDFKVSLERKGEFTFLDGTDIKCKIFNKLQIRNFFVEGAFVEILGNPEVQDKYKVSFTDRSTGQVVHSSEIGVNCWTKTTRKYFTDYNVSIVSNEGEVIFNKDIDYLNRRVYIALTSKAIGDTVAWMPMVEEFRKKHTARIICSTFHNNLFKGTYPDITFINPGEGVSDIYAQFNVGCFDNELDKNKFNWRITPLQKVAADILGLIWKSESLPNISYKVLKRPIKEKYVAISEHSTVMCKYWLYPDGWKSLIEYINKLGFQVAVISKEGTSLEGIVDLTGKPLEESINNIYHSEMFIGTSSGPSWLAWALRKPLVLISGFSAEWAEMDSNAQLVSRVVNKDVCNGCFNDPSLPFDRGDWRWCPRGRDFECSKMITPEMVIEGINKFYWKQISNGGIL